MAHASAVGAVLLVLIASSTYVVAVSTASPDSASVQPGPLPDAASATENYPPGDGTANNSTHHENPFASSRQGNLRDIQHWLSGQMVAEMSDHTIELSQEEYGRARSTFGKDFGTNLERYVNVAGKTDANTDDRVANTFQRLQSEQKEFTSSVQRYRRLHDAYETARQNGNAERARTLARRLERVSERVNDSGHSIETGFDRLSNTTDANLSAATERVLNVSENISETQTEIREETFVETKLTATVSSKRVSFLDPLRLRSRLTTVNGSAVGNESIRIKIGNRTVQTKTDADGTFSVVYRPTTLPVGPQSIAVRYRPVSSSAYLGSNASVRANVTQVSPIVRLKKHTNEAAFAETVSITGRVHVENVGASGVPVVVRIGTERVGRTRTNANGTFSLDARVPATVSDGERPLRISVPLENRALAAANATTEVSIRPTDTELTANVTQGESAMSRVTGRLTADGGTGVAEQTVVFRVDGTPVGKATTGANGTYAGNVTIPAEFRPEAGNATVKVDAVFTGAGTNLKASRATMPVRLSAPGSERFVSNMWPLILLGGGVLLAFGMVLARRYSNTPSGSDEGAVRDASTTVDTDGNESQDEDTNRTASSQFERARSLLAEGRSDEAVDVAYAVVRRELEERVEAADGTTHWEFYAACRNARIDDERLEQLRALTQVYERATFTPRPVPMDDAETAIERAIESTR